MKHQQPTILHVDMDAYFAAIEQRDNPELRGKPVVIGSPPDRRGVVSTASYEARRYGIHSAMPSRTAYQHCPQAIFLPVRMAHYQDVSRQIMELFYTFSPDVEPISIDEAFIDVSSVLRLNGSAVKIAHQLRQKMYDKLQLTCSIGVASNKFLAKIASDYQKPNGITVVPTDPAEIIDFLAPLPVKRIWGVGKVANEKLRAYGITIVAHLQEASQDKLIRILGSGTGCKIWHLAQGIDYRRVNSHAEREKSISNESTFSIDCADESKIKQALLELTENVGRRLRQSKYWAGVIQLKLRYHNFKTITRQISFPEPLRDDSHLLHYAQKLFADNYSGAAVRLIGIGVSKLVQTKRPLAPKQLLLFEDEDSPQESSVKDSKQLDDAVDDIRKKYGVGVLHRGNWKNINGNTVIP